MIQKVSQRERPLRCEDKLKADMIDRSIPKYRKDFTPHPDDKRFIKNDAGQYVKFDKAEILPNGFMQGGKLLIKATIGRSGIQNYLTGMEIREPSEVFSREHLTSLINLPVTINHGKLEPDKKDIVGHIRDVLQSGQHIEATIEISDPYAIRQIQKGLLSGFSLGYTSNDIIKDGQTYQTNLKPFHLALLPTPTHSRCGTTCKILDLKEVA